MDNHDWLETAGIIDHEHAHAMGVISAWWNVLEYQTYQLLAYVGRMEFEKAFALSHDLKIPAIFQRILSLAAYCDFNEPPESQEVILRLKHAKDAANVCRENRNLILHSLPLYAADKISLIRIKGPVYSTSQFPSDFVDLRRVAGDIHTLVEYSTAILEHLRFRHEPSEQPPLPEVYDLPKRLWSPSLQRGE